MSRETHLDQVKSVFDASATIVENTAGVPEHWHDYAAASEAERLAGLRLELRTFANYFPKTAAGLESVTVDAFLVQTENRGLCRILMRQIKGKLYLAYSRCPTAQCESRSRPPYGLLLERAPDAFSWIYQNLMDGLVDPYDFVGFVPSDRLITMDEEEAYEDFDWYDGFVSDHDPGKVVEFFSNGGGAYMLLDLNKDWKAVIDPQVLRVSSKGEDWTPDKPIDFWPVLDAWMAIGLADS